MVGTLGWVLVGIVCYTLVAVALDWTGKLPAGVEVTGPLVTLRSARGRTALTWLARPARGWRAFATVGVAAVCLLAVVMALGVVAAAALTLAAPGASPIQRPSTVLVVPGVNTFLPLAAGPELLLGILVGLVVHEGCHGVLCRVEDIPVADLGLVLFTLLPLGAFVQPDAEETRENARGWVRMFAAGPASNLVVTAVTFGVLVVLLSAIVPTAGVAVGGTFDASSAADAGIERGDVLTAIDGQPIANASDLETVLSDAGATVQVQRRDAPPVRVERRLTVVGNGGPLDLATGTTLLTVNGTAVRTAAEFRRAIATHQLARLDTSAGSLTAPMGLSGTVSESGALAAAGLSAGTDIVLTELDGRRVLGLSDLEAVLANTSADASLSARVAVDGSLRSVTLSPQRGPNGDLLVGLSVDPGTSGLELTDFGVGAYPADRYLGVLAGQGVPGERSLLGRLVTFLTLPLASLVGIASYNFAGFLDPMTDAFALQGPLAGLGGAVFTLSNVCYWVAWLNVQVALFNCLPLWPLDGGRILRIGTRALGDRVGIGASDRLATAVTAIVGVALVGLLLSVVFVPALLG